MIRSIVFTTLMFLSIPPYAMATIIARIAGVPAAYAVAVAWARMITALCQRMCGLSFTVEGREHVPDVPSVVFMKHSSAYETITQMLLFPLQCWVLKRELMWTPFFGWALAAVHPIAINRGDGRNAVSQVLEQGQQRLDEGIWVMIFPEGTRMPPGETRRYGVSGTLLAQKAGRLIVPVAHNAGDFWPRRGLRKRPGNVRFIIGPPFNPAGRDARQVNEEIQRWIEGKVAELREASA